MSSGAAGRLTSLTLARALTGDTPLDHRAWPDIMRKAGLKGGAITRGGGETVVWDGAAQAYLTPPPLETIGDVTGAGDGFAAGFLHARIEGGTIGDAIMHAAASARLALASEMATAEDLSRDLLMRTLPLVPPAEIVL